MLTEKPRIPIVPILLYGFWPGFLKKLMYRLKGYRIGKGVSIGFGAIICGEDVQVGDYASIGFFTVIRGKEIRLGSHVRIGAVSFLDTPHIDIGEGTNINEQVFVGGLQFPNSRFVVGTNCSIMQMCFINPAKSVLIGDDCVIGGHCLIFGHSSSLNHFEGYGADFAPIEIGRGVGLAWRAFVLPGTKIGDGAVVGASSVVSGTVPPYSMAVGFPARIVGRPPVFPKRVSDPEKVEIFARIMNEMVGFLVGSGLDCEQDGQSYFIRQRRNGWGRAKTWRMQVTDGEPREALKHFGPQKLDLFVSLREIPVDVRDLLTSQKMSWIDIAGKAQARDSNHLASEVLSFFKRYGVRTLRYPRMATAPVHELPSAVSVSSEGVRS